jgi:tetratricopeptide (TPR) repeat protein
MSELELNLDDALIKVNLALSLIDKTNKSYPNILDTKAEVLWKLGDINNAIDIINQALLISPDSEYYKTQKEKYFNSSQ